MPIGFSQSAFDGVPGAIGEGFRSVDWSSTALGPVESWPAGLGSLVSACLETEFPMCLFWGREYVQIYNAAFAPILGALHPKAMGESARITWSGIWDFVGPRFASVMDTGKSVSAENQLLFMERNGYKEETYFSFTYSPVRDGFGPVAGILCVVTESTGRVVADRRMKFLRALAAEAAKVRVLSEAYGCIGLALGEECPDIPFAILYEEEGAGVWVLRSATGGIGPGTVPHRLGMAGSAPHPLADAIRKAIESGSSEWRLDSLAGSGLRATAGGGKIESARLVRLESRQDTGPRACLVLGWNPHRELDAEYLGFLRLAATHMETALSNSRAFEAERRRAEVLAELDRAKTVFFGNISHEFRTPLTLLLAPLESELASPGLSGEQRERLQMAHRHALRLLKLVNALLDFSRLEAGRIQACYEPFELGSFTAELTAMFRSLCETAGLSLEVDCPATGEFAFVDRDMWEKVVLNLVSNAYKFTFQGGIRVAFRESGAFFELSVQDSGIGIPEAEMGRIFERFHRVQGTRSRTHEGSGIGLALVHELVRLHGGTVRVSSEPGRGTEFLVRIPKGKGHLPPDQVRASAVPGPPSRNAAMFFQEAVQWDAGPEAAQVAGYGNGEATVLVVDDNADMRKYLVSLLQEHWSVVTASDGRAALDLVTSVAPDLILCDVMMPGLDGIGVLRAIRETPATRTLPVVLLSARAGTEASAEGLAHGADDYLIKPFSPFELIARVRAHLGMARARKESAGALLESQQQLLQAQKLDALGRLAGGIAHDFNNLLTAMNGYAEMGLAVADQGGPAREFLSEIRIAGQKAASLTARLLGFSRKQSVARRPLDLAALVSDLSSMLRRCIPESNLIEFSAPPLGPWAILADKSLVEQSILNLAMNAADAMPGGGKITIRLGRQELGAAQAGFNLQAAPGRYVVLTVEDNGIGMGPEIIAHLFEPFFTTKSQGKGTGLGLANVHAAMKQLEGAVRVESAPKQGTAFHLFFPESDQRPDRSASDSFAKPDRKGVGELILLVEDEESVRKFSMACLRSAGYRVWEASNGSDAMRRFGEQVQAVDLLLTDVVMPEMGGRELSLWFSSQNPSGRIVFMSGYTDNEDIRLTIKEGEAHFLPKPFSAPQLTTMVHGALRSKAPAPKVNPPG